MPPRKTKHSGGIFLGNKPEKLKELTRQQLDEKAFEFLKEEPGGYENEGEVEQFYDLITYDSIHRNNPKSYITFARGENHVGIYNTSTIKTQFDVNNFKDPHGGNTPFPIETKNAIERFLEQTELPPINTMVYSYDGSMRAFGHIRIGAITIQFMDEEKEQIRLKFGMEGNVYNLSFHPDGNYLAACINNPGMFIHIWDIAKKESIKQIKNCEEAYGYSMSCYSPDGNLLVGVSSNTKVHIYDVSNKYKRLKTLTIDRYNSNRETEYAYSSVIKFDNEGKRLILGMDDGSVYVWVLPTYKEMKSVLKSFKSIPFNKYTQFKYEISAMAIHPDNTRLIIAGDAPYLMVFNLQTNNYLYTYTEDSVGQTDVIKTFAIHPNGRFVAVVFSFTKVAIWDIQQSPLRFVKEYNEDKDAIVSVEFRPDKHILVAASIYGKLYEYPESDFLSASGTRGGRRAKPSAKQAKPSAKQAKPSAKQAKPSAKQAKPLVKRI